MDLEKAIITKSIKGNLRQIINAGVLPKHFINPKLKEIFEYVIETHRDHGTLPTKEELKDKYKFITIKVKRYRTPYLIEQFQDWFKQKAIMGLLKDGHTAVSGGDSDKALQLMHKSITDFSTEFSTANDIDMSGIVDDVRQDCKATRKMGGISGIPSPWEELDKVTGGWNPEDFIVLCSRPKVGKTWLALKIASFCAQKGYRVLFISKDMSTKYIKRRYLGLRSKIPYKQLKTGILTTPSILKMKRTELLLRKEKNRFILIEDDLSTETGVNFLDAKVEEYKPDIIFIDGVYLLADDGGNVEERIRLRHVSRDCKKLARRRKIPVFAIHQITRDKVSKKTGEAGAGGLYGSDGFIQDADLAIELIKNKELAEEGAIKLKSIASREGEDISLKLEFELDNYKFAMLENEDEEEEDSTL